MGLSKEAPPSYLVGESTPGRRSRASSFATPFGKRGPALLRVPSSRFLTVSTGSSSIRWRSGPCGASPPPYRRRTRFQHASDPGVHHVSAGSSSQRPLRAVPTCSPHPRDALLPYEAFPPCTAAMTDEPIVRSSDQRGVTTSSPLGDITTTVGRPTATRVAWCSLPSLPSHRCPLSPVEKSPSHPRCGCSTSGLSSVSGSVAPCAVARA